MKPASLVLSSGSESHCHLGQFKNSSVPVLHLELGLEEGHQPPRESKALTLIRGLEWTHSRNDTPEAVLFKVERVHRSLEVLVIIHIQFNNSWSQLFKKYTFVHLFVGGGDVAVHM